MNPAKYAKAIVAFAGGAIAWVTQNVQVTDGGIFIPLSPEAAGTAAAVAGLVYAVWRIPNQPETDPKP